MATSRTFLINASTRHAIFVNRFAGGQARKAQERLSQLLEEVSGKLARGNLTEFSRRRLRALYDEIERLADKRYSQIAREITKDMRDFGRHEAEFSGRMFEKASEASFAVPTIATIEAAILSTPLKLPVGNQKVTIEAALRQFSKQKRKELIQTINSGVIAGKTNEEIVKDLTFVTNKVQKNHALALTRTVTNHTSTVARGVTMEENADIIEGYEWVATLDSRTTHTCQSLDGQVFPVDSGTRPPAHWGCRSTMIPVVKKEYSISNSVKIERPAKVDGEAESVSARSTYNSWLKKQSPDFQNEVLGPQRAKLFREGGLSLKQFTDSNYRPLTLEELKNKEPMAFDRAGLE